MDYDFLPVSNGSGDAATMTVTNDRLTGSTTLKVSSVANVPAKFIGTYGTLGANNLITPASKRDFKGHVSGADIIIDAWEPGSTDAGNTVGQIVLIKPNTGWSNRVAKFIKDMTGFGTPPDIFVDDLVANTITVGGKDVSQLTPTGLIAPFGGAAAPGGWLLCDGAAVSRTTYAALFAVLGTTYGAGNGTTTFNLPDTKGRSLVGVDSAALRNPDNNLRGQSAGAALVALSVGQLPSHQHTGNTGGGGDHNHASNTAGQTVFTAGSTNTLTDNRGGGFQQVTWGNTVTSTNGNHGHSFLTDATGSNSAHENRPPYLVVNHIIKT